MEAIFSFFQTGIIYVSACVILLGVLIFVHELGHFLVARWCNVRVEVFSLGFGKKIWQTVRGDTTYCVSMIPLGGYVKMFGEQPGDTIAPEDRAVSFTHKTVWQRIAIVLAGPIMNLLFAILIFAFVAMIGTESRIAQLGDIAEGTKAYQSGFRSGDYIEKINTQQVRTYDDVVEILNTKIGQKVDFVIRRNSQELTISSEIGSRENPNPLSLDSVIADIEGFTPLSRGNLVGVVPESILWKSGLRSGDRIVKINGQEFKYFRDFETLAANSEGLVSLEVERLENKKTEKLVVTYQKPENPNELGMESSELYLARVLDSSPASRAGLQVGDRLVKVAGKTLQKWEEVLENIKSYNGQGGVEVEFLRGEEAKTIKIEPEVTTQMTAFGSEDKRYTIGISAMADMALPATTLVNTLNPFTAVVRGIEMSYEYSVITLLSFVRLFQNKISPKTVGGLLSIGQAAGETFKMGISKFLLMMAIISINLFILNLLPVPVLDGGHLVFYTIEVIKGSPLSIKKMEMAQQVGMVLLMGLMVFALFNDVTRIVFGRM